MTTGVAFAGAVLCGGASRRMGTDKALLSVGGRPLAVVAADALADAGASPVICVGGDATALASLGLSYVPDDHAGDGPLGGILTALRRVGDMADVVVVLACDLPFVSAGAVRAVVEGLSDADACVPVTSGRQQPLLSAWRVTSLPAMGVAFEEGERSPLRALDRSGLAVASVALGDDRWALDVDTPEQLAALERH